MVIYLPAGWPRIVFNEHPQDIRKIIPSSHLLIQSCPVPFPSHRPPLNCFFLIFLFDTLKWRRFVVNHGLIMGKRFMSFKLWAPLILNRLLLHRKKCVWDLIEIKVETNFLPFSNCALVGGEERALKLIVPYRQGHVFSLFHRRPPKWECRFSLRFQI